MNCIIIFIEFISVYKVSVSCIFLKNTLERLKLLCERACIIDIMSWRKGK